MRIDREGRPSFVEVNPLPGLNPVYSDLPMLARQNGWSFEMIIGGVVESAVERWGGPREIVPDSHTLQSPVEKGNPGPAEFAESDWGILDEVSAVSEALNALKIPFRSAGVRRLEEVVGAVASGSEKTIVNLVSFRWIRRRSLCGSGCLPVSWAGRNRV